MKNKQRGFLFLSQFFTFYSISIKFLFINRLSMRIAQRFTCSIATQSSGKNEESERFACFKTLQPSNWGLSCAGNRLVWAQRNCFNFTVLNADSPSMHLYYCIINCSINGCTVYIGVLDLQKVFWRCAYCHVLQSKDWLAQFAFSTCFLVFDWIRFPRVTPGCWCSGLFT